MNEVSNEVENDAVKSVNEVQENETQCDKKGKKKKLTFKQTCCRLLIKYSIIFAVVVISLKLYGCMRQINRAPSDTELALLKSSKKALNEEKTAENLLTHVKFLSIREKPRNYEHMDSLNECADYINDYFSQNFYFDVSEQEFNADGFARKGTKFRNIIATTPEIKGAPYIIVGAHYDCFNTTPGADDNASGVAVLLEVAKKIAIIEKLSTKQNLKVNVVFAAYANEEPPFFTTSGMGSYVHAQSWLKNKENIDLMLCLEMLGYYSDEPNSQNYPVPLLKWFFPTTGNFVASVGNSESSDYARLMDWYIRKFAQLPSEFVSLPSYVKETAFSDHRNFWEINVPAVMLTDTAFFRNKNYHELTDTYDTLNYQNMAKITNAITVFLLNYEPKNDR
ncbi:M28 family peptidase [Lentisphaerota bacterium WC36G]|nr:M28 family peptidase [Lentisphaerae bacterium WC36]